MFTKYEMPTKNESNEILNEELLSTIQKMEIGRIESRINRTFNDNYMIRVYAILKMLLYFKAEIKHYDNVVIDSENIFDECYELLLAMVNNKRFYNKITIIADGIKSLNKESAEQLMLEIDNIENMNSCFNIYDRVDTLESFTERYSQINAKIPDEIIIYETKKSLK